MKHRDAINSVSPETALKSAFMAIDAIQDQPKANQIVGAFALVVVMSKAYNIGPRKLVDMLAQSEARINDALKPQSKLAPGEYARALIQYLKDLK